MTYADGGSSTDEDTPYDTHTRKGSHVEVGLLLTMWFTSCRLFSAFLNVVSFY
jgi:hypothetical protein